MPLHIIVDCRTEGRRTDRSVTRSESRCKLTGVAVGLGSGGTRRGGHGAVLLGPRLVVGPVTCAIAVGGDGK